MTPRPHEGDHIPTHQGLPGSYFLGETISSYPDTRASYNSVTPPATSWPVDNSGRGLDLSRNYSGRHWNSATANAAALGMLATTELGRSAIARAATTPAKLPDTDTSNAPFHAS